MTAVAPFKDLELTIFVRRLISGDTIIPDFDQFDPSGYKVMGKPFLKWVREIKSQRDRLGAHSQEKRAAQPRTSTAEFSKVPRGDPPVTHSNAPKKVPRGDPPVTHSNAPNVTSSSHLLITLDISYPRYASFL